MTDHKNVTGYMCAASFGQLTLKPGHSEASSAEAALVKSPLKFGVDPFVNRLLALENHLPQTSPFIKHLSFGRPVWFLNFNHHFGFCPLLANRDLSMG